MLQSELHDIKEKFDSEQQRWEEMYYKADYQSRGFQWRKDGAVELCVKHLPAGCSLLDLGCGCGHASTTLAKMGYQVFGADISEPMISQAATNARLMGLSNCEFQVFDFVKDEPKPGKFDGLIALGFIEYFDDPEWVLKRMHELLKRNGIAIVQIWNRRPLGDVVLGPIYRFVDGIAHPWRQSKRLGKAVLPEAIVQCFRKVPSRMPLRTEPTHRRYTPGELRKMAEKSGFKIIDAHGSRFFPSKFFFRDTRRVCWDKRLQEWTKDKPMMQKRAIDYIAALRKA